MEVTMQWKLRLFLREMWVQILNKASLKILKYIYVQSIQILC